MRRRAVVMFPKRDILNAGLRNTTACKIPGHTTSTARTGKIKKTLLLHSPPILQIQKQNNTTYSRTPFSFSSVLTRQCFSSGYLYRPGKCPIGYGDVKLITQKSDHSIAIGIGVTFVVRPSSPKSNNNQWKKNMQFLLILFCLSGVHIIDIS